MKKNFFFFQVTYFVIVLIVIILGLEIGLRFFLGKTIKSSIESLNYSNNNLLYKKYTKDELSNQFPYRHEFHGGRCTRFIEGYKKNIPKLQWHPRYGFVGKIFDVDCINKLFSKKTKNIIFFGGSGMANVETPNYITSIEYYLFKDNLEKYRSVNFSMSGSRLSNNLSIFLEYVPRIHNVDVAIFYDGINEFHSIKFNGNPSDDFFWTAGVKKRIHNPLGFFLDAFTSRSKLMEVLFLNILKFDKTRIASNFKVIDQNIELSANDYIYRKKILEKLCKIYKIECIFILQPSFYLTKNNQSSDHYVKIKNFYNKFYPNNENILNKGYAILQKEKNLFDFTNIFDDIKDTYFDDAHVDKNGSEAIAVNLKKILLKLDLN